MGVTLIVMISLGSLGGVAAAILYFASQKFKVYEDPRIDTVEAALPAANCGGCGYPGCRGFAEALVKAEDLSDFNCPVGGADVMKTVASILGKEPVVADAMIAVVRCSGSCDNRPKTNIYDGALTCAAVSALYGGETACSYGCHGLGDCVVSCDFDAIHMDELTGLPVVNDKCVACGACVKACPNDIIELRKKGPKDRRIYVSCVNHDKGAVAKKACNVACIGCSKCFNVCPFDAITMNNNLAYIDYNKCKLCRKCVDVCPTNSIHELNFPPKKVKVDTEAVKAAKPDTNTDTNETNKEA